MLRAHKLTRNVQPLLPNQVSLTIFLYYFHFYELIVASCIVVEELIKLRKVGIEVWKLQCHYSGLKFPET